MTLTTTPRVWIGCLASYNAGRLIGEWVDATDADEMYEAQKRVAAEAVKAAKEAGDYPVYFGEPEEFFIADYDNFGGELPTRLGEYPSYEQVARLGALVEEHGEAFLGFLETCEPDLDTVTEDDFHNAYRGVHSSREDYAHEEATEIGLGGIQAHWPTPTPYGGYSNERMTNVIEELSSYIDWEKVARDLFRYGTMASHPTGDGRIHVYDTEA